MLGLVHLVPQAQQAMRAGEWPLLTGRTLKDRRLGILGLGRHGANVARIAKTAFGMEVVAWASSEEGNHERTARLLGAADRLRSVMGGHSFGLDAYQDLNEKPELLEVR